MLLGEFGCGKSTLLNIIGGLDTTTSGTFVFMGKDMENTKELEMKLGVNENDIENVYEDKK